ncbi:MAG: hypothetical protein WDN01_00130 [Rhizomicrobium sp.]
MTPELAAFQSESSADSDREQKPIFSLKFFHGFSTDFGAEICFCTPFGAE